MLLHADDFVDVDRQPLPSTVALLQQKLDQQNSVKVAADAASTTSFLSLIFGTSDAAADDKEKREKEDKEALDHAKMIVVQCKIEELFGKASRALSVGSIGGLLQALVAKVSGDEAGGGGGGGGGGEAAAAAAGA
eukprot:SAG22_NODE_3141_length_1906_cov_18.510791_5_plen_134_part_01